MKIVNLKDVFRYNDSDTWLYEECSAKVLMVSPQFIGYNDKKCAKVNLTTVLLIFVNNICK